MHTIKLTAAMGGDAGGDATYDLFEKPWAAFEDLLANTWGRINPTSLGILGTIQDLDNLLVSIIEGTAKFTFKSTYGIKVASHHGAVKINLRQTSVHSEWKKGAYSCDASFVQMDMGNALYAMALMLLVEMESLPKFSVYVRQHTYINEKWAITLKRY